MCVLTAFCVELHSIFSHRKIVFPVQKEDGFPKIRKLLCVAKNLLHTTQENTMTDETLIAQLF